MPNVSERGTLMPASPIRRLTPLANDAKSRGIKVYHLNIGQPDVPTPQEGLDALKNIGCITAKNVLATPRETLIEKADLEESTVDNVLSILKAEFDHGMA